jgi:APA family basic amino acid/polyamine antiporter
VTGLITVAAALSYGELAGMIKAGGQFVYIQRAYGRLVFFIWLDCFTVIQTGVIAAIAGLQTILRYSFGIRYYTFRLGDSFVFPTSKLLAIASIIVLTFINTKGIESGN